MVGRIYVGVGVEKYVEVGECVVGQVPLLGGGRVGLSGWVAG